MCQAILAQTCQLSWHKPRDPNGNIRLQALSDLVACLSAGTKAAFEVKGLAVPPKGATLKRVSAYATTVPGVGNDQPPGC